MSNARRIGGIEDLAYFENARRVPLSARQRENRSGPYPYYGASGIFDYIDEFIFEGRHLLISEDGENLRSRKTPIAFQADGRFWVNNHAHILSEKAPAGLDYLEYVFSALDISPYVTGAAQPKLNKRSLCAVPIPIPEETERVGIVRTLNAFRDKIDLNRRTAETSEAMARSVFRDWFVAFGPVRRKMEGANDPHAILGSLLPEGVDPERTQALAALFPDRLDDDGLPKGWARRPIGDVAEIVGGSTPSTKESAYWEGGAHAWATPRDLSRLDGLFLFRTDRRITDAGLNKITSGISPVGTVLLSSRAPIGYTAITDVPVALNQGFIAIRPTAGFPTAFSLFWCRENMDAIKGNANGSTFQEISKKNFRPLFVTLPLEGVMQAYTATIDPLLNLIRVREDENRTLATTRDHLLPRLMSGELRVEEAREMAEAS